MRCAHAVAWLFAGWSLLGAGCVALPERPPLATDRGVVKEGKGPAPDTAGLADVRTADAADEGRSDPRVDDIGSDRATTPRPDDGGPDGGDEAAETADDLPRDAGRGDIETPPTPTVDLALLDADGAPITAACELDPWSARVTVGGLGDEASARVALCPIGASPDIAWGAARVQQVDGTAWEATWPLDAPDVAGDSVRLMATARTDGADPTCVDPTGAIAARSMHVERAARLTFADLHVDPSSSLTAGAVPQGDTFTLHAELDLAVPDGAPWPTGTLRACVALGRQRPAPVELAPAGDDGAPSTCQTVPVVTGQARYAIRWPLVGTGAPGAGEHLRVSLSGDTSGGPCGGRLLVERPRGVDVTVLDPAACGEPWYQPERGVRIVASCDPASPWPCHASEGAHADDLFDVTVGRSVRFAAQLIHRGPRGQRAACWRAPSDWRIEALTDRPAGWRFFGPGVVDHGDGTAHIPAWVSSDTAGEVVFFATADEPTDAARVQLTATDPAGGEDATLQGLSRPVRWQPGALGFLGFSTIWTAPLGDEPAVLDLMALDFAGERLPHHRLMSDMAVWTIEGPPVTLWAGGARAPTGIPLTIPAGASWDAQANLRLWVQGEKGVTDNSTVVVGPLEDYDDEAGLVWRERVPIELRVEATPNLAAVGTPIELRLQVSGPDGAPLPGEGLGPAQWIVVHVRGGATQGLVLAADAGPGYRLERDDSRTIRVLPTGQGGLPFDASRTLHLSLISTIPTGSLRIEASLRSDDGTAAGWPMADSEAPAFVEWR